MAANGWCPSGRFFEAAACGTPLITDAWEGLDSFFNLSSELRVVASAEEVEAALATDDADLQSMAARARQRTLDEHTGMVRARQLLQYIEEARSCANASMKKEVAQ
jgi:spore maturation protein CgeB